MRCEWLTVDQRDGNFSDVGHVAGPQHVNQSSNVKLSTGCLTPRQQRPISLHYVHEYTHFDTFSERICACYLAAFQWKRGNRKYFIASDISLEFRTPKFLEVLYCWLGLCCNYALVTVSVHASDDATLYTYTYCTCILQARFRIVLCSSVRTSRACPYSTKKKNPNTPQIYRKLAHYVTCNVQVNFEVKRSNAKGPYTINKMIIVRVDVRHNL